MTERVQRTAVEARCLAALACEIGCAVSQVTSASTLNDLGLDDLDRSFLAWRINSVFGIEVDDDAVSNATTVCDIIDATKAALAEKVSP
ncbi:MAG: hypothetical protein JWP29_1992 [Rhodoferax sp.]|nr:hypothetical protein [Rhodoferax sp.]